MMSADCQTNDRLVAKNAIAECGEVEYRNFIIREYHMNSPQRDTYIVNPRTKKSRGFDTMDDAFDYVDSLHE